jgi:hypothetical protein
MRSTYAIFRNLPKVDNHPLGEAKIRPIWDRCYDHNFLRFLPIFGEKMAFFSKTNVMIKIWHNLALF